MRADWLNANRDALREEPNPCERLPPQNRAWINFSVIRTAVHDSIRMNDLPKAEKAIGRFDREFPLSHGPETFVLHSILELARGEPELALRLAVKAWRHARDKGRAEYEAAEQLITVHRARKDWRAARRWRDIALSTRDCNGSLQWSTCLHSAELEEEAGNVRAAMEWLCRAMESTCSTAENADIARDMCFTVIMVQSVKMLERLGFLSAAALLASRMASTMDQPDAIVQGIGLAAPRIRKEAHEKAGSLASANCHAQGSHAVTDPVIAVSILRLVDFYGLAFQRWREDITTRPARIAEREAAGERPANPERIAVFRAEAGLPPVQPKVSFDV